MNRVVVHVSGKDIELEGEDIRRLEKIKKAIGGDYKTAINFSILLAQALIESRSVTTSSNI